MKKLSKLFIISLFFMNIAVAEETQVFEFTEDEFKTLEVRKVRGADSNTEYSLGSNENGNFLKAVANNSASGLM